MQVKRKAPRKGPVPAEQQTPSGKHPHGSVESCAIPAAIPGADRIS